ncbi:hypothetical protein ACF0H5_008584 [Mactra antiquata]
MLGLFLVSLFALNVATGEHDKVSNYASMEDFTQCMTRISLLEQTTSTKLQKQEETIQRLEEQIKDLTSQINGKGQARKRQVETPVAFSATINQAKVSHIGVHQNIVFSDVITNVGANYHNFHGIFTVPRPGLYLISTTLLSSDGVHFSAALVINGTEIVRLYEKGENSYHGSASQTIVVQLKTGDDVAVQSRYSDTEFWGDKFCSFTAVLLQEMDTTSAIVG